MIGIVSNIKKQIHILFSILEFDGIHSFFEPCQPVWLCTTYCMVHIVPILNQTKKVKATMMLVILSIPTLN